MGFQARVWFAVALCGWAIPCRCQDVPKVAVFVGYSYLHGLPLDERVSLNGWAAGAELNLTRRFGLALDATGDYGGSSVITGVLIGRFGPPSGSGPSLVSASAVSGTQTELSVQKHSFLVGPEFRPWQRGRARMALMGGIGAARYTNDSPMFILDPLTVGAPIVPTLQARNGLALGGGVNVDVRLTRRLSYRVLQSRFVAARLDSSWERGVQLSTGLLLNLK